MISKARIAAAAFAAAAVAPWPAVAAAAHPFAQADREREAAEVRLRDAEAYGIPPDEAAALRADRSREAGERQLALGHWRNAAILLGQAVDEPDWRGARERPSALFHLADALRREGLCGAARVRFAATLALGDPEHRAEAVAGALECAVKERRAADVERLLSEAERAFPAGPPAEVRYVAAKALFERRDLPAPERIASATAAFEKVGPPYRLQAWYFQGVLRIQEGDLHGSLAWFEACADADARDGRDLEVHDLCQLALGRVHAEMGDATKALLWYAAVRWDSPRFPEALHEAAWAHVRAKQLDRALATVATLVELEPESPFAPEATLLKGHLLLRLARHADASEAYNFVINSYAPVRDEIDALLSMQEDPAGTFDALVDGSDPDRPFDLASLLPPTAVKWAAGNEEVSLALGLVQEIDGARREVKEARDLADRLDALLQRGGGLDAFPALQRGYAQAAAAENAAARAEGMYVAALESAVEEAVPPERRGELSRAREARRAIEPRFDRLPRGPQQVAERLAKLHARVDGIDREAFRLEIVVRGCAAAIGGTEAFVEQRRSETSADAAGSQELAEELQKHRAVVDGYGAELVALRQEIARVRDVAGGVDAVAEESRLRAAYLEAVERERVAAEAERGAVRAPVRSLFARVDAARMQLEAFRSRARVLQDGLVAAAKRRAANLRERVAEERVAIAAHDGALDGMQAGSRDLVAAIALRSMTQVRAQLHRLVLKADLGVVDVAWSRKRQRLEKIQQLAVQKSAEIEQLDRESRTVLREVD